MAKIIIPEDEYELIFSRSSSKGGQNVDKVSTKVTLKWNVLDSTILDNEQKRKILEYAKNKIDKKGNLIIYSQDERYQIQNRKEVIDKFNNLINDALKVKPDRIPTRPSRLSKEKRLREKKERSEKKQRRQKIDKSAF